MTRVRAWQRRVSKQDFCTGLGLTPQEGRDLTSIFIWTMPAITMSFVRRINDNETNQYSMRYWSKRKFLRRLGLPENESGSLINAAVRTTER